MSSSTNLIGLRRRAADDVITRDDDWITSKTQDLLIMGLEESYPPLPLHVASSSCTLLFLLYLSPPLPLHVPSSSSSTCPLLFLELFPLSPGLSYLGEAAMWAEGAWGSPVGGSWLPLVL